MEFKEKLYTIILAAGKGTRMKSDLPKVLHKINNQELVKYVISQAEGVLSDGIYIVTGFKSELVEANLKDYGVEFVEQKEQNGTGHAVMQAEEKLQSKDGNVLILCGDAPLLKAETLLEFRKKHENSKAAATVLTAKLKTPFGYGRIVKDNAGNIERIVEEKDASDDIKKINEINSGVYLVNLQKLFGALKNVSSNNAQNEYYLTDIISILKNKNEIVSTYLIDDDTEIMGINDLVQLANAEQILNSRK